MSAQNNVENAILEMIHEFEEKRDEYLKKINVNNEKIEELIRYLCALLEQEDRDFKVFSPRNVESVYREQIEKEKLNCTDIENDNHYLYKKLSFYTLKLNQLNEIKKQMTELNALDLEGNNAILQMQENERQRIARDLHDTVVQNLVHLGHKIDYALKIMDQDTIKSKMEIVSVHSYLKETIEEIRDIIYDLHPMSLDDLGFLETIERLQNDFQQKCDEKLKVSFEIEELDFKDIDPVKLISIYRVIQESCNNTIKHANATVLNVFIKKDKEYYVIEVNDNGCGFEVESLKDKKSRSFGLSMIHERIYLLGGTLEIHSNKQGTIIRCYIPAA